MPKFRVLLVGASCLGVASTSALAQPQPKPVESPVAAPFDVARLARQIQALREAQGDEQSIELVEENWPDLVAAGLEQAIALSAPRSGLLWNYFEILEQRAKAADAQTKVRNRAHFLESLKKALTEIPAVLDDRGDWIYSKLVAELIADGRLDEALQWAKRRYVLCAFDAGALERAAVQVERVMALQDPSFASHQAWVAAQRNPAPGAPNPLAAIEMPVASPEISAALIIANPAAVFHSV